MPSSVTHIGSVVAFAAAPLAALALMLAVGLDPGPLSHDFHYELYPQAEAMLDGRNPYPARDFDPLSPEPNLIWPPVAAFLVSPLTLLPVAASDVVIAALGLVCFAAALWLVGVRDWRIYGVLALWPQVVGEMRVSHLTPVIAVLLALAWRHRTSEFRSGAAVGAAIALKFLVWPVAVWLAATRRIRGAATAIVIAGASLLLILPFTELTTYAGALDRLGRTFDQDGYTPFGLLVQLGVSEVVARTVNVAVGLVLLLGTWRCRSLALAVAASLVLSPIVWLDYFALLAVPLAAARPRLSAVWFVPLGTWGAAGSGIGIGDPVDIARVLAAFAIVTMVALKGHAAAVGAGSAHAERHGTVSPAFVQR
jgi:hypothetical protein